MQHTLIAWLLGILCATAFVGNASAGPERAEGRAARYVERMAERLDLSNEQRAQLDTIVREQGDKRRALREESQARIEGILTAQQREQWARSREARKAARKARREARRANDQTQ
ncbi:MAG: hypothetical protein GKR94_34060 [Gammaproteobacteria bacterium]|nr:hypothetical protein [Gammaproteobacteria bacterium]